MSSSNSVISPDILSALVGPKRAEMLQLIHKFKNQQIQVQEFLTSCRVLLGPRLYAQLATNMNQINSVKRSQQQQLQSQQQQQRPQSTPVMLANPSELLGPGIKALSDALVERPPPPNISLSASTSISTSTLATAFPMAPMPVPLSTPMPAPMPMPLPQSIPISAPIPAPSLPHAPPATLPLPEPILDAPTPLSRQMDASMPSLGPGHTPSEPFSGTLPFSQTNPTTAAATDTSKMDTDSLQDILQYSGVDLKEEAENILKEQDFLLGHASSQAVEDHRCKAETLFHMEKLERLVSTTAEHHRLLNARTVDASILDTILLGLQFRLAHLLDDVALISRQRVDVMRSHYKIRIENDPKRQILAVEKLLQNRNKWKGSATQEGDKIENTDSSPLEGASHAAKKHKVLDPLEPSPSTAAAPTVASAPSSHLTERDEVLIKTKITNATALGQLGIPVKSWMLPLHPGLSSSISNTSSSTNKPSLLSSKVMTATKKSHPVPEQPEPSPIAPIEETDMALPSSDGPDSTLSSQPLPSTPMDQTGTPSTFASPASLSTADKIASFYSQPLPHATPLSSGPITPSRMSSRIGISDKEWRSTVLDRRITISDLLFYMQIDPELSHSPLLVSSFLNLK